MNVGHTPRIHGGPDGGEAILYDFSTNANLLGPAPLIQQTLQSASRVSYPDPDYLALRQHLAQWHQTDAARIVIAASAGEFIWRLTHWLRHQRLIRRVCVPQPGYGEYRIAAERLVIPIHPYQNTAVLLDGLQPGDLAWCCAPCNPTGESIEPALLNALVERARQINAQLVFDLAYAPLQLDGEPLAAAVNAPNVWRLWSPNKACGLTGIRGAYAIAPSDASYQAKALAAFAPSWVLGIDGLTLLQGFANAETADWLATSRESLREWRAQLLSGLSAAGWTYRASSTHFLLARPPIPVADVPRWLTELRRHGIKLRDATSFGLPGWVRLRSMPVAMQDLLWKVR